MKRQGERGTRQGMREDRCNHRWERQLNQQNQMMQMMMMMMMMMMGGASKVKARDVVDNKKADEDSE